MSKSIEDYFCRQCKIAQAFLVAKMTLPGELAEEIKALAGIFELPQEELAKFTAIIDHISSNDFGVPG